MDLGLEGKLVVLGGGRGVIGSHVQDFLQVEGAEVIVADKKDGVDLSDPNVSRDFFVRLRERYPGRALHGYCSMVYDGAGVGLDSMDQRSFMAGLNGTFFAAVYPILEAVRWMQETNGGHIVIVSSVNSILGLNEPAYDMSKAALNQLVREIATSQGQKGIYAVSVCPGSILGTDAWPEDKPTVPQLRATIPDGNITTPGELANVVGFLMSKHARLFSGSTLIADRGWHIHKPAFASERGIQ